MYEKDNGPKRLAKALYDTDDSCLKALAHYLRYDENQLKQDIQAMYDQIYNKGEETE